MKASMGRIVFYRVPRGIHEQVATNRQTGAPAHSVGNPVKEGDVVPMLIIRTWLDARDEVVSVNGQAFLDGNDTLWITAAREGDGPGQWFWPPRVD